MSDIGKKVRLNQLFNAQSGNSIMVARDHAAMIGPIARIENLRGTVDLLSAARPDTFFMPIGAVQQAYPAFIEHRIPFIVAIDTCTQLGPEPEGAAQHIGLGTNLLAQAEDIARQKGFRRLAVIAAIGTRRYYASRGFSSGELYMIKEIEPA